MICLIPSLNGTPFMSSARWLDPSSFRHFSLALKISLKVMASAVLRLRQPLVFTVRWRTVANVLSIGLVSNLDQRGSVRCLEVEAIQHHKAVAAHSPDHNHINQERHLYSRDNFKRNRTAALSEWRRLGVA